VQVAIGIEHSQVTRLFRKITHPFVFRCRAKQAFLIDADSAALVCDDSNSLYAISTMADTQPLNLINVGREFEQKVLAVEIVEIGSQLLVLAQFPDNRLKVYKLKRTSAQEIVRAQLSMKEGQI